MFNQSNMAVSTQKVRKSPFVPEGAKQGGMGGGAPIMDLRTVSLGVESLGRQQLHRRGYSYT